GWIEPQAQEGDGSRGYVGIEAVEVLRASRRAEPGQLPLSELARCEYSAIPQLVTIESAFEMPPRLPVPDAAHRGEVRCQRVPGAQSPQLVDKPAIQHRVEAILDSLVQLAAVGGNNR